MRARTGFIRWGEAADEPQTTWNPGLFAAREYARPTNLRLMKVVAGHSREDPLPLFDSVASVTKEVMFVDQKIHKLFMCRASFRCSWTISRIL